MTVSKRRCINCRTFNPVSDGIASNFGFLCSKGCQREYGLTYTVSIQAKVADKKEKAIKVRHKAKAKELRTRTEWYNLLQTEVNKYVRIRDAGEPCCTCGTTNPNIKYDAGHCFPVGRGGRDPRRFLLMNIHRQCSVNCNQFGSGMRHDYEAFISTKYGHDRYLQLKNESNWPLLKDQFPHWTDIEKEIIRYRKLNKYKRINYE